MIHFQMADYPGMGLSTNRIHRRLFNYLTLIVYVYNNPMIIFKSATNDTTSP